MSALASSLQSTTGVAALQIATKRVCCQEERVPIEVAALSHYGKAACSGILILSSCACNLTVQRNCGQAIDSAQ
ncbi:MAG: hypothetical protein KME27_27410 [Lyngbya sp. HA4199-MV5]|nr:hypothetical protein [Lyngbya sp. HA4199-MV5]